MRPRDFLVWEENWQAVTIFMAVQTQWRTAALGGLAGGLIFMGLDYAAALAVIDLYGIIGDDRKRVFDDLRIMEDAAMAVLNGSGETQANGV